MFFDDLLALKKVFNNSNKNVTKIINEYFSTINDNKQLIKLYILIFNQNLYFI